MLNLWKKMLILVFITFFFQSTSIAKERLTWQKCLEIGKEKQIRVVSAKEDIVQSKATKSTVISSWLPQINANLSGTRSGNRIEGNHTIGNTIAYGVSVSQLLFDGGKTVHTLRHAEKDIESANLDLLLAHINGRQNLREAFIALLRDQKLLVILKDIVKRKEQNLQMVRLRYEAGSENMGSLLTAEADLSQSLYELNQLKRTILVSQSDLARILDYDLKAIVVEGELLSPEIKTEKPDFTGLVQNHPRIKKMRLQQEKARLMLQCSWAAYFPTANLDGSVGKTGSRLADPNMNWSVGCSITLPLFTSGKIRSDIVKSESRLKQAELSVLSEKKEVTYLLKKTWSDLVGAHESVNVSGKFLKAVQNRAQIANIQYANGLVSFNDWRLIEEELASARKAFLRAKSNLMIQQSYWYQAQGGGFEDEV